MAKPGSNAARRIASSVDLSLAKMTDAQAQSAQEAVEWKLGMRCSGCGRRVGIGLRFTSLDVRDPRAPVMQMTACSRQDCDFAEKARDGGTCMEAVEYVWLDENGLEAPAAQVRQKPRVIQPD